MTDSTSTTPLTTEEIEAIRWRETAATRGPWAVRFNRDEGHGVSTAPDEPNGRRGDDIVCLGTDGLMVDLGFIAAARDDIPRLLATLAARDEEIAGCRATIGRQAQRARVMDDGLRERERAFEELLVATTAALADDAALPDLRNVAERWRQHRFYSQADPETVKRLLDQDLELLGTSFEEVLADGSTRRIDPATIRMRQRQP